MFKNSDQYQKQLAKYCQYILQEYLILRSVSNILVEVEQDSVDKQTFIAYAYNPQWQAKEAGYTIQYNKSEDILKNLKQWIEEVADQELEEPFGSLLRYEIENKFAVKFFGI